MQKINKDNKNFYSEYSDKIIEKRLNSKNKLRQYVHHKQYNDFLEYVKPGMKILDAGCGEGALSVMMAKLGAEVTGTDISQPNIEKCWQYAKENGIDNIKFLLADSENLPFANDEFDLVVSSHVLEHLPNFDKGLSEVLRVSKKQVVVAIPTILNLCSVVQVGGGFFWSFGKRSLPALFLGTLRLLKASFFLEEGVNENYAGNKDLVHIFRFPWIMENKIKKIEAKLIEYQASSICLPFCACFLPIIKFLDRYKKYKFFRNFGYGTTYVLEKNKNSSN